MATVGSILCNPYYMSRDYIKGDNSPFSVFKITSMQNGERSFTIQVLGFYNPKTKQVKKSLANLTLYPSQHIGSWHELVVTPTITRPLPSWF